MKSCVDWYKNRDPFVEKKIFEFFAWGIAIDFVGKKNFHRKHTNFMFLSSVFDGDHESDVILIKMFEKRMKYIGEYRQFMPIDMVAKHIVERI